MEDGDDRSRSGSASSSHASTPLFASSRESTPDLLDEASDIEQYSTASTSPSTSSTCSSLAREFLRSPSAVESSGSSAQPDGAPAVPEPDSPASPVLPGLAALEAEDDTSEDEDRNIFRPRRRRRPSDDDPKYDVTPKCPKPMHKWCALLEFNKFQTGGKALTYRRRCYGNLHMAQRLELMAKLDGHWGCVNSINFNAEGDLLVSGSDDLHCMMWEWESNKLLTSFGTSHRGNIFQSKFMPHKNNLTIITSARDGSVRLHQLDEAGAQNIDSRKIGYHRGPVHRISMHPALQETILSAGEDACVFNIDIRIATPMTLVTVECPGQRRVGLYSVAINPLRPYEFMTSGKDQFVRVFDRRNAKPNECVRKLCPDHLSHFEHSPMSVSSAVYNYNGSEILATYSDEDIYIFPNDTTTLDPETADTSFLHRYQGHRNSETVRGVNYFGQRSEYVVSGSDCGHIFLWDKETTHIVNCLYGDEERAVKSVEPNPTAPYLATSGFDHDVKIWAPSAEKEPTFDDLRETTIQNMRQRHRNLADDYTPEQRRVFLLMMNSLPDRPRNMPHRSPPSNSSSDDETPQRLQRCSTS